MTPLQIRWQSQSRAVRRASRQKVYLGAALTPGNAAALARLAPIEPHRLSPRGGLVEHATSAMRHRLAGRYLVHANAGSTRPG